MLNELDVTMNDEIEISSISNQDMYEGIRYDEYFLPVIVDGQLQYQKTCGFHNGLNAIDRFVHEAIASSEPAFLWIVQGNGKVVMKELALANHFRSLGFYRTSHSQNYEFSEHVMLFFDCINDMDPYWLHAGDDPGIMLHPMNRRIGEYFNDLIQFIRKRAAEPEFRRKVSERKSNCARNFRSAEDYIAALFENNSKLLVLRIDLGYMKECATSISLEEISKDRERFLNNFRSNRLFTYCVGYVLKLEQGDEKGFHIHLMLFYNGNKVHKDGYIATQVGNYWKKVIANNRGTAFNCNLNKNIYQKLGIGMIEHSDQKMRNGLMLAVKYLTKKDQFMKIKTTKKMRAFYRGEMPKKREAGPGRPRTRASLPIAEDARSFI